MTTRQTYTVNETAEILGISRESAFKAVKNGDVPSFRIGKRILIPRIALEALLNSGADKEDK
jgi:excisionase family DNA binding protein|tara:strand:- start:4897 stop:5082 length:186 start_codon:yes stop_codon:yes gene_type:complete